MYPLIKDGIFILEGLAGFVALIWIVDRLGDFVGHNIAKAINYLDTRNSDCFDAETERELHKRWKGVRYSFVDNNTFAGPLSWEEYGISFLGYCELNKHLKEIRLRCQ